MSELYAAEIPLLPPNLIHLRYGQSNPPIPLLPSSLKGLTLGAFFNSPVDFLASQTPNLKFMSFDYSFNQSISASSFPSLTHLVLCANYSQPILSFPKTLTHIRLGESFNHPLSSLPPNLIHIWFGKYHHPLPPLPPTLTHLKLRNSFDHPIELPASLTHAYLGNEFNQPLVLPPKLSHLFIIGSYTHPLTIPKSLTCLVVRREAGCVFHVPPEHKFSVYCEGPSTTGVIPYADNTASIPDGTFLSEKIWGVFENCDDFTNE